MSARSLASMETGVSAPMRQPHSRALRPLGMDEFKSIMLADGSPLGIAVENLHPRIGGPVVCTSTDPQWGRLAIWIQNNTDAPITLDGQLPLSIGLSPLLADAEIGVIRPMKPWRGSFLPWEGNVWVLAPDPPLTLEPKMPVSLELDNVLAAGAPTIGFASVSYAFSGKTHTLYAAVMRQKPPSDPPAPWPIDIQFEPRAEFGGTSDRGDIFYVTQWGPVPRAGPAVENEFVIEITNASRDAIALPAGAAPMINFAVLCGDTPRCLTTKWELGPAFADVLESDPDAWQMLANLSPPVPMWSLVPAGGARSSYLGKGGFVLPRLGGLYTFYNQSLAASPLFIQCAGLPAYDDAYFIHLVEKTAPQPYAMSFELYAGETLVPPFASIPFGPLTLRWNVFGTSHGMIAGSPTRLPAAGSLSVSPCDPVNYTLEAVLGPKATRPVATVVATVTPPTVSSFTSNKDLVQPGESAELTWSCGNGDHCTLLADGVIIADGLPLSHSQTVAPTVPVTTYEIVCHGAGTASGQTVVKFPQVEASIKILEFYEPARKVPHWGAKITWSTTYASSCIVDVAETGQLISTALSGTADVKGHDSSYSVTFRIRASGNGTTDQRQNSRSWP